ncbi:ferric aerobactin receptor [Leptolyngbya boryana NIES-2135]|uniref:Ferric aerobactin receptor n=1 Tax=Leptolyngbya boryana NIES-2135 TaxID=1973484 RepID=A0A1Z4JD03_LEPBY|nr:MULTISPECIES: TonB-dependent receptor [Leptolyngbya]BAY54642.1 ferric aerobactin receptor [Leptolyngbya boryana NIES-2135]MBD2365634.1 TonB-dependent receptor [Leptolyngbya sp. FACHB-161]MBD2371814.1 TonB-dependent receptor [Leptolyngbya sp. FACHB-238]MBD2396239.1 TonB-dependent receptor [Leptolyngbya sp. FACHB-239]MBD2402761.1 TonB-dependent receptor [Leptolyngbya sp. FACHB-402]
MKLQLLAIAGWSVVSILATPQFVRASEKIDPNPRQPAQSVMEWMAQIEAATVQVNAVKLERSENELDIILETVEGEPLQIGAIRAERDRLIAEIPNAILALPEGQSFQAENPTADIALVQVIQESNQIRVFVIGKNALPQTLVTLRTGQQSYALNEEEESEEEEVVVTATRTEEGVQNVPRSVTVVTREQIQAQSNVNRDLTSILGTLVPGLGASSEAQQSFTQTLRGRPPLVLIDGVPISSNIDNDTSVANLRRIDIASIDRVEVVRGPSAIYGDGAAGGVINIITRRAGQNQIVSTAEIGVRSVGNLRSGSFGNLLQYGFSGQQGNVDFAASITRDSFGTPFDAEGDRPPIFADSEANSTSVNLFGKLGVQLDPQQRFQITANYFNDAQSQNGDYDLTVGAIPGIQKARFLDRPVEFIDSSDPFNRGTLFQFDYRHDRVLNSKLQAQVYYRETKTAASLFDNRVFDVDSPLVLGRSVVTSERFGGRLQLETPLASNLSLLWGADYSSEDSEGNYDVFDVDEFDSSGGRRARRIGSAIRIAPFTIKNLGFFSQLQWDVSEKLSLSGGVRYDNFNVSVVDNWIDGETGFAAQGGDKTLSDVVFNAGIVYKLTPQVSLFTNFAQGFSLPNLSRILQQPAAGFNFAEDVTLSAPQKVDSYELGIRGRWRNVQASLAGFYSYSSLGTTVEFTDIGDEFRVIRSPQRNYGVELAVDWQPSDRWKLGGTLTWSEGEREDPETQEFLAITGYEVSPLKLSAYLENETLPGWNNRLQAVYIGRRNRAFNAGIDPVGIESYLVVDLISSLKLGNGTLSLGVKNLLNNQYLNIGNQLSAGFDDSFGAASRGRVYTLTYRWSW